MDANVIKATILILKKIYFFSADDVIHEVILTVGLTDMDKRADEQTDGRTDRHQCTTRKWRRNLAT